MVPLNSIDFYTGEIDGFMGLRPGTFIHVVLNEEYLCGYEFGQMTRKIHGPSNLGEPRPIADAEILQRMRNE